MPAINIADLNNAKTDVDHIAAIATSLAATATDRMGNLKPTLSAILTQISAAIATAQALLDGATGNVQIALDEATAQAVAAAASALAASISEAQAAAIVLGDFLQSGTGAVARTFTDKAREIVTPFDFGCVGDGVTDDTVNLQKFFDYIATTDVGTAHCHGDFAISSTIYIGPAVDVTATRHIVGFPIFRALNAIDVMVDMRTNANGVWDGKINVIGIGSTSFASRTCRIGVRIAGTLSSSRMKLGGFLVNRFYEAGISVGTLSSLSNLGDMKVTDCGSGALGFSLTGNWSNPVNSGSSGSTSQRTVIDVTTLPPEGLSANLPVVILIDGEPHFVYSVDRATSRLTVFPWVKSTAVPGAFSYIFGGGVFTDGGDAGILGMGQIDAIRCGAALWSCALYGPVAERIVTQSCGVGYAVGGAPDESAVGYDLNGLYCENNVIDFLKVTRAVGTTGGITSLEYALSLSKVKTCGAARLTSDLLLASADNMRNHAMYKEGEWLEWIADGTNNADTSSAFAWFVTGKPRHRIQRRDSWTINIQTPDNDKNRLYGYGDDTLTIIGPTNVNGAPTGTFTFNPPVGYTVNGTTVATFSGFIGPAIFIAKYRVAALDFEVRCIGHAPSGNKTFNPTSLADGAGETTTVTVTDAALGDYAEASFALDLQGVQLTAWVSAANTVSVRFQNETGGTVDLGSALLRARVRKAN